MSSNGYFIEKTIGTPPRPPPPPPPPQKKKKTYKKNGAPPIAPPPPPHQHKIAWGGRGGKATFFSCEVGEVSEALERESSQLILSPIAALPDINWNSKC